MAWESMSRDLSEESGGEARRESAPTTPGLAALRSERLDGEAEIRRALQLAALEASGEVGYRALTVQRILDRSEVSRSRFYKSFPDKAACYQQAYQVTIEHLVGELLMPCEAAADWLVGFRRGLEALELFLGAEPLLAKGLLAEIHVAGGAAMAKRKEVFERLSRAIDLARRETSGSRHSPPPMTATFILNAIEAAVVRSFRDGRPSAFAATVPDLTYIAVSIYFGDRAARAAIGD
jgi:AcrR family transcriptional regulator